MARAIGKSQGHDAASADMTPASARFIFLGRSHCLRDRASRTAHVLHTKLRRQLSLSFPPQPPPNTPPLKTWAQRGAPALAISFFPLAQSAAPTAWKESLSEHQNCLDHSRNRPAVPPRITAGTTMKTWTTLSSKFQIAIPKDVREAQNWKPGQEFAFIPKGGGYLLVPCPTIQDVNGGGIMLHAERPDGPVAAAQNCATHGPLSVATRGGGCTAWSSMRRFDWRLSTRV